MKKKGFLALMVVAMVVFLAGCGGSSKEEGGESSVLNAGAGECD